jgi:hypothetical protein
MHRGTQIAMGRDCAQVDEKFRVDSRLLPIRLIGNGRAVCIGLAGGGDRRKQPASTMTKPLHPKAVHSPEAASAPVAGQSTVDIEPGHDWQR